MFGGVLNTPLNQVARNCQKTNQTLGRRLILKLCIPRKCGKIQNKKRNLFCFVIDAEIASRAILIKAEARFQNALKKS